jgi:predicted adenylyl cyclase CyaB
LTLPELRTRRVFDDDMTALFYRPGPNGPTRLAGMLRLRKEGPKTFLTFKGPVTQVEAKVRDEDEIEVSDYDTTRLILRSLGLVPVWKVRKHRVMHELENARFAFDRYQDELACIPEFLEIEAPDIATIHDCVLKLGLRIEDCRPWRMADLIDHYRPQASAQPLSAVR